MACNPHIGVTENTYEGVQIMAKGKTRTIVLTRAIDFDNSEPGKVVYHYRVQQVTDSIAYHINDFLKPETVDSLCNHDDWRVTIK